MSRFGIPYMGSKDFICDKILNSLPPSDHFYDLFGGGFSVSHCALLMNKWGSVHYNEINSDIVGLVRDAIAGKYSYENEKPRWISREEFAEMKDHDAYVRICWSFGNNQKNYIFGKDIEGRKKSLHQAVIFDEFDDFAKEMIGVESWNKQLTIYQRRIIARRSIAAKALKDKHLQRLQHLQHLEHLQRLQHLQRLERLQRLQHLEHLQRLQTSSFSYEQVEILPNSIVYCDPPYRGTAEYLDKFDHDKFDEWVVRSPHPIFVSEYAAAPRLHLVFQKPRKSMLSANAADGKRASKIEKVFANEAGLMALRKYQSEKASNLKKSARKNP